MSIILRAVACAGKMENKRGTSAEQGCTVASPGVVDLVYRGPPLRIHDRIMAQAQCYQLPTLNWLYIALLAFACLQSCHDAMSKARSSLSACA